VRITALAAVGLVVAGTGASGVALRGPETSGTRAVRLVSDDVTAASVTRLGPGTGLYPRVVRLEHSGSANGRLIAGVVTFKDGDGIEAIYQSDDDGRSFTQIGSIADSAAAGNTGLCCGTLFELPRTVGTSPAGTLLWAASFGAKAGTERRMQLRVWRSLDQGRTWSHLSTIATAANTGGLWEPEFTTTDGALVAFYSDETDALHSQKIVARSSSDGQAWSAPHDIVSLTANTERPGMPVVRRLPNGRYAMSFEACGSLKCEVRLRSSTDGLTWGSVTSLGIRPSVDGRYFAHAATIAPRADGSLLLIGQMLVTSGGSATTGNGTTVFIGADGGTGAWRAADAPVPVPGARNDYCPNYSSALLPAITGTSVLELATDYAANVCTAYFATAAIG
jgi:hypothetical protein